jgi:L-threonylcarbamoyladenylate synthase
VSAEWLRTGPPEGRQWDRALDRTVKVLKAGGVVSFATDTFYAIGADPLNTEAVSRVYRIKARDTASPIPLLVSGLEEAREITGEALPAGLCRILVRFWPGPLTVVLPCRRALPAGVRARDGTVGLRWPGWAHAESLLRRFGGPLTGSSANRSGAPEPTGGEQVCQELGRDLDLVLDTGPTPGGPGSTVVGVTSDARGEVELSLIRPGGIALEELRKITG